MQVLQDNYYYQMVDASPVQGTRPCHQPRRSRRLPWRIFKLADVQPEYGMTGRSLFPGSLRGMALHYTNQGGLPLICLKPNPRMRKICIST